jgi:hypothetical protein
MKSIYYNRNIERAKLFANQIIANVSPCCGGEWFVCVDEYAGMDAVTQYGDLPNPKQAMKTFSTQAEAVTFAKGFNPTKLTIQERDPNAKPWYEEEGKWRFAFD